MSLLNYIKALMQAGGNTNPLVYNIRPDSSMKYVRIVLKLLFLPLSAYKYLFPARKSDDRREGLAFVLIAKNEAPYIEEWINFHHKHGVSHFIIYDNESTDNFHEVLKPYIASGLVSYQFLPGKARQMDAYNIALHNFRHKFKYMGFIDADEFVYLRNSADGNGNLYEFIDKFMKSHKNAGGIAINWCIFGSSGHITKPEGGVLENYTMCAEDNFTVNLHIKTICDPQKVLGFNNVHYPIYCRGFRNLNENGKIVRGPIAQEVHFSKIRINHYFTKSREEYKAKKNRGRADTNTIRLIEDFDIYDKNDIHDTEILRLV